MFNKVENLSLLEKYELDIYIKFDSEKPIKGKLITSQDLISLKIYNTSFNFDFNYEKLVCEYKDNKIELINLESFQYSTDFYSHTKDIVFSVEKVFFKEYYVKDTYKKLIIKSKDINQWTGFTKLQRELGFEIQQRLFVQHKELFKSINCTAFTFNIFYEIHTAQDTFNGTTTYTYLPFVELDFKENQTFEKIEKIYFELLDLFYLLLGFNLEVEKIIFQSDSEDYNNSYLYYKRGYVEFENKTIFIALANDLFEQCREQLNLEIFKNYFELTGYQKSFFNSFRKYKMFHYTEDKFLGYFRILENLMFDKKEIFTEEYLDVYIANITIDEVEKIKEKDLLLKGSEKTKSAVNSSLCKRKEKIKFILFHEKILKILPTDFKLIVDFVDIEKIVKLRNDISHFNDYIVTEQDLEKYIDYLEFLINYVLLRLLGYSDENFKNNSIFYPAKHRVFDWISLVTPLPRCDT